MNTTEVFTPKPMSAYDNMVQPKPQMNNIADVSLESIQQRVLPRQVSTGNNRGEMTVKGLIRVVDTDGSIRLILGYKKNAF